MYRDELGDGFLSDMDEDPVDMEEIREGMKLVPLPDMYADMETDSCFPSLDDIMRLQATEDAYRLSEEGQSHSGEAKAAKVAAQAAPDVLTGGVVAESGPPPDFSLWTVEDDLLLKNAMEAGAAMEALARGAMRFSRRYTVRELRERWRALLYDPEVSSKAAVRMVEAEAAFLESMRLMFPNKQKLQDFVVHKRRQKSVRDTFYKRKRCLTDDTDNLGGDAADMHQGEHDSEMLMDPDDHAFSQMVDLLATGGIGAVIGALPAVSEMDGHLGNKIEAVPIEKPSTPVAEKSLALRSSMSPKVDEPATTTGPEATTENQAEVVEVSSAPVDAVAVVDFKPSGAAAEASAVPSGNNLQTPKQAGNLEKESKVEPHSQQYVIVSSDDEEEQDLGYYPEPKRPRTGAVVQENLMCTFNTQETEIPAFGNSLLMSSPSSGHGPSSPDDAREDATSELKSSDCADYSGRPDGDEYQSTETASQAAEGHERPGEDTEAVKVKAEHEAANNSVDVTDPSKPETSLLEVAGPNVESGGGNEVEGDEAAKQLLPEVESDTEMPHFSDVETMILDMDLDPGDNDVSARAESKRFYRQHQMTILRLEQSVSSAMQRYLTLRGAIAVFYGYHMEYFVKKNEVSIGRMTQGNVVDIDLGQEGRANKVSRKQASIKLSDDGLFYLKNMGKKVLYVNDVIVVTGQRALLSSNCLIEVGGMRFIFEINRRLLQKRMKEMTTTTTTTTQR